MPDSSKQPQEKTLCFSHRTKDAFVRFKKSVVMDKRLSWKAKGILLYAFSRPSDWIFYREEMVTHSSDGNTSFDSGIKELEKFGYCHRLKIKEKATGRFKGLEWHFFEDPIMKEEFKKMFPTNRKPCFRETPTSAKPETNKNEFLNKNENNKQESIIFSSLRKLHLPKLYMEKILDTLDEEKANLLVTRVLRWKNRESDLLACRVILERWEAWGDSLTEEESCEKRHAEIKKLFGGVKLVRFRGLDYQITVGEKYIEFLHSTTSMLFEYKDCLFEKKINAFFMKGGHAPLFEIDNDETVLY